MPQYFFETDDGEVFGHDLEGIELADNEAARRAAQEALPDMAREKIPDGDCRTFVSTVRNEGGVIIYSVVLNLLGR